MTSLGATGHAFSRVSYGADTLKEQMLLQSESGLDRGAFAIYFEDDETVFTDSSAKLPLDSETAGTEMDYVFNPIRSPKSGLSDNSIVRSGSSKSDKQFQLNGGQEFAQRFRTVAQVMLAPCGVGPSAFMAPPTSSSSIPTIRNSHFAPSTEVASHVTKVCQICAIGHVSDSR